MRPWPTPSRLLALHTGGVPEVVASDETGILVELDNISALVQALVRLIQNKDLRKKMGVAALSVCAKISPQNA